MTRPIEIRQGRTAWSVMVAPDARIPAYFWGAYRRPTFAAGLALLDEVVAGAKAYAGARDEARRARQRVQELAGGEG